MARSVSKQEETVQTAHTVSLKDVPIKREGFMQPLQGRITAEKVQQRLLKGMQDILGADAKIETDFVLTLANRIVALGNRERIMQS